jgi:hypothetical protein
MKIILSRKGFDSNAGGYPSIVYNNEFYSFPIPQKGSKGINYEKLEFCETKNYADVFKELDINIKTENGAHLDPDLRNSIYKREIGWKPIFGQADKAEAQLKNNKVEEGDIFLFFGWFKFAKNRANGQIEYYEKEDYKGGFHAIFGYLQVEKRIDIKKGEKIEDWMTYHPHYINQSVYNKSHNSIYVSKNQFEKENIKGAGLFKFDKSLILTGKNCSKGVWYLDEFFNEICRFSKFKDRIDNNKIRVSLKGYYPQELMISDNEKVKNWATNLIKNHAE